MDRNSNRLDNNDLFYNYVLDNEKAENIILELTAMDFSKRLHNEHEGYENELLYVLGKDVELLERFGSKKKQYRYILNLTN